MAILFGYFSLVIFRSYITRIKNEKQKRQTIDHLIMNEDLFDLQENDMSGFRKEQITDNLDFDGWSSY